MMKNVKNTISVMRKIFEDPKLRGKHVIMIAGHIFTARTGKEAVKLFKRITAQYPDEKPTVTYIPKAESLILMEKFATLFFSHQTYFSAKPPKF